jgi:predicted DNA-binding transcriptional regulator YafY
MRADRLLSIMLLLQVHRQLTSKELSRRLEVSQRTIHRDMEALSGAGVPVYALRGAGGGWVLDEGFRTGPVGLKEAEIRALFLARPPRLMEDLGLNDAAEAGLVKLLGALPRQSQQSADDIRQRIHLDAVGWRRSEEATPCLAELQTAVWTDRKVRLIYRREGANPSERVVDPLGLVASGPVWYLVAAVDGDLRTYRVSRIEDATILGETTDRPPSFDLAEYWQASKSRFVANLPVYEATLRLDPEVLPSLQRFGRPRPVIREDGPDAEGRVVVTIRFDVFEEARETILGWGPQVEVIAPAEFRAWMIETTQSLVDLYRIEIQPPCANSN